MISKGVSKWRFNLVFPQVMVIITTISTGVEGVALVEIAAAARFVLPVVRTRRRVADHPTIGMVRTAWS
ncbi:MAG: hypothetical protein EPN47_09290 [Acidobacteria bacterium]|nr:MAG: hypothetical protein EPN47_09290 [Acidobacteriota bacterium]